MVKSCTVPCGTVTCMDISGARLWVGPMMKFPSASAGGMAPSGNSLAVTNPGVFGSRVGGVERAGTSDAEAGAWANAGFTPAIKLNTAPSNVAP